MLLAEATRYNLAAAVTVTPISFHLPRVQQVQKHLVLLHSHSRLPAEISLSLQPKLVGVRAGEKKEQGNREGKQNSQITILGSVLFFINLNISK